jgi:hypothetical protein
MVMHGASRPKSVLPLIDVAPWRNGDAAVRLEVGARLHAMQRLAALFCAELEALPSRDPRPA